MAEWTNLTVDRYLTVTVMNNIYNNFLYLSEKLATAGNTPPSLSDCRVSYSTSPEDVIGKFNSVEENIDKFHETANYNDIYYINRFRWETDTDMELYLRNGVKRWLDWLNSAKKHIDGEYETAFLTDINGKQITDKNKNKILVFKEW